jgi:hypothetical protein
MELLFWTFQFAFGCHHGQLSRVFTIKQRTYQVCFKCGREFEYSWALMQSLPSIGTDNPCAPLNEARPAHVVAM